MYYPTDATLSTDEISELNERIAKGKLRGVLARSDKYTPTVASGATRDIRIDRKNLSVKNICRLCFTFLKSKVARIALSSFMIAVIMVILALSETIIAFDSGKIIRDELKKMDQRSIFMEKVVTEEAKSELGRNFYDEVTDEDIERFKTSGYTGEIYRVLNYNIPIDGNNNSIGIYENYFGQSSIYTKNMMGTMIVDEKFLTDNFGDYEYVASADEFHPAGIIITDYLADVILTKNRKYIGKSYDDLIGEYYSNFQNHSRGYINAVIKTDYKEDFKELFEEYGSKKIIDLTEIREDERFIEYANAVYSRLGFAYTTNQNFEVDFAKDPPITTVWHFTLKLDEHTVDYSSNMKYLLAPSDQSASSSLAENEVVFSMTKYNEIFGTNYTASTVGDFVPHTVLMQQFAYDDYKQSTPLIEKRIYIKAIDSKISSTMRVSDELYSEFCKTSLYTKGLYFYGGENMHSIIPIADELSYKQQMSIIDGIHTMTRAVDVFVPIFELVAMVLCAGVVFILINFSTRMIRDKMHDIGILKALGCKNSTIGAVFGLQLALIAVFTIILSSLGYFFFIDLANTVLIDSLKILADGYTVIDMKFLSFKASIACLNSVAVIALTAVSFIIPMIRIYKIKPVKIIKAKE
jgi:ABC-type antimicrobial peptide transport system permease subunit